MRGPTRICKVCFKEFSPNSLFSLTHREPCLCNSCLRKFDPKFIEFRVGRYKGLSVYEYDETIKAYLYQFKGCFDFELAKVFLERYYLELSMKYSGFNIVPVPSFYEDNEIRGFNHVEEIFKPLKLPILKILKKTSHFKQAEHSGNTRNEISQHLVLTNNLSLRGKKILLVDDVYTTGSTIKACIELLKELKPKRIEILVMSKTPYKSSLAQTN